MTRFLPLILAATAAFAACKPRAAEPRTAGEPGQRHADGAHVEFNPGRVIQLGPDALRAIGIETAEVALGGVQPVLAFPATVFAPPATRDPARATAQVPDAQARSLRPGQPATASLPNGRELGARITGIHPFPGIAGLFEIILDIHGPPEPLAPGTRLRAAVRAHEPEAADAGNQPVVPDAALLHTARGPCVYVANGPAYLRTPVTAGASRDGFTEILDGLFEGDTIVTRGARDLYLAELQAVNAGAGCTHAH